MLGRDRAKLRLSGNETEVRPRLAEILALLCAKPGGYSAESLAPAWTATAAARAASGWR